MSAEISQLQLTPQLSRTNTETHATLAETLSAGSDLNKMESVASRLDSVAGNHLGTIVDIRV